MSGQLWVTDSLGGYLANPTLSKKLRLFASPEMRFRQFVGLKEAFGMHKDDTKIFDKVTAISTAGGTLIETDTMPEHNFTVNRGSITITEYGNSVPYTGKLEALSEFDVDNTCQKVLRKDQVSVIDKAVAAQFQASDAKYVCLTTTSGTLTTNGTAGGTAGCNLNDYHVKQIVDQLRKWNVPNVDGDNYVSVGSVNALRGLRDDDKWLDASKYGKPERLFSHEVGKHYSARFVEENNSLSNVLGGSYGEAVFFGDDAVMEAVAIPEEVRAKIPTDYGRSKGVAWYFLGGWQIVWQYADDEEQHIIHVTSL